MTKSKKWFLKDRRNVSLYQLTTSWNHNKGGDHAMINGWIIGGTPSAISHWIEMEKRYSLLIKFFTVLCFGGSLIFCGALKVWWRPKYPKKFTVINVYCCGK
jgi:hypothetical protein